MSAENIRSIRSFTLVELLIVIAILAVLAAAVVIVLNPAELLAQARDSQRISDIRSTRGAIDLFIVDNPTVSLGSSQVAYISLPDSNSDCSGVAGLPTLRSGWTYRCATSANIRGTTGAGWIPVDFSLIKGGSPIPILPLDPDNDINRFYVYVTNGSGGFSIYSSSLESAKYTQSSPPSDGGSYPFKFEVGTNLLIGEGVTNVLTSQSNRLLLPGHSWSCYQDAAPPHHLCDAGIVQTLVTDGYSQGSNSIKYDITQSNRGAVSWDIVPYGGNQYYHYKIYVKARPGSGGKKVFLERYSPNGTLGAGDSTAQCTISESYWTLCRLVWLGRTGDGSTALYIFPVGGNLPVSFDIAFPVVEKRSTP